MIYTFKIENKYRRGLWRTIEIRGDQTLGELDGAIREAFRYDTGDHLSEFYNGKVWRSEGYGEIHPGGGGPGGKFQVSSLGLSEGQQLEHVYDFGDDVQSLVKLERVSQVEPEAGREPVKYPRIVAQNRVRHRYCAVCEKDGRKTVATDVCEDCSNEALRPFYLCGDHVENHSDGSEHHIEEVVY